MLTIFEHVCVYPYTESDSTVYTAEHKTQQTLTGFIAQAAESTIAFFVEACQSAMISDSSILKTAGSTDLTLTISTKNPEHETPVSQVYPGHTPG